MKKEQKLDTFTNNEQLSETLSVEIAAILAQAIEQRGHAYLAVSGGRTPRALFEKLSRQDIDWHRVTITLADERWVWPDSDDSNDKLVKTTLLKNKAAQAQFISLLTNHTTARSAEAAVAEKLAGLPTFDAVILGMGDDGHTASLFPCSQQFSEGLDTSAAAIAVMPETAPYERISLTASRLLNSSKIFFHINGESKLPVLQSALAQAQPGKLPISAFLHQTEVPVSVYYAAA
ncbi:6-phosphogluconolactonase [Idiomarina seosinensis]|uniref:6-phosphogluconolactonase n=1 Tax=Idiomarina seosinensis TaxID=281739 RepID=A0A432ZJZ0_9GAMM|nr:6-phosphogluconolactonase [Idiomarina seosinensis]